MMQPAAGGLPAVVATRGGSLRIGTGHDATMGERRIVRIDGEPVRGQATLGEQLGVLWLTPSMDRLFIEKSRRTAAFSRSARAWGRPGARLARFGL